MKYLERHKLETYERYLDLWTRRVLWIVCVGWTVLKLAILLS